MDTIKRIVNFLFELNEQKRTPRNGWHRAGVKNPESVAEHTAVCAQIAYLIALMEGADAPRAAILALFHDAGEVREGDYDWVSRQYRTAGRRQNDAALAQIGGLPMTGELTKIIQELQEEQTPEAIISKDADKLELALQARVYGQSGYKSAALYLDSVRGSFKTGSAKKLLAEIEKSNIEDWWLAIPEIAAIAKKFSPEK